MDQLEPNILVLSGGGSLGYAHLGVLECLEDHNLLSPVHTFVGNSIGAVISLLCALNFTAKEIWTIFLKFNMEDVLAGDFDWDMLTQQWGIEDGDLFEAFLVDILISKGINPNITLRELKSAPFRDLIVVATRSDDMEAMYFSSDTTPDVKCIDAVRASVSIPFLFTPHVIQGDMFLDGFLSDNFPLHYAEKLFPQECIWGSIITSFQPKKPENLLDVFVNVIGKLMNGRHQQASSSERIKIIRTQLRQMSGLDWTLSVPEKEYAKNQGYISTTALFA